MEAEFRPDVEGLRAVAVMVVVLFHVRLGAFSGGFVGVDVFFVLSGFLITRLLLRELATTGTISLPGFWARRARRLLPASVLVIVATVLVGRVALPPLAVEDLSTDALAAGGFVVNVVFAHRLGDYFAAQQAESPLLHFWSLAVEEQFYLVWPIVLVVLARRPRQYRRLLGVAIAVGVVASLLASVWLTRHRPTWAFYLLPARMGELLAGAAVALAGRRLAAVPAGLRAAVGWFGVVGIAVAVFAYDAATPFPGTAAWLPVLATVLVIAAGGHGADARGPMVALRQPVAQWIGRHSYAIYLWHWPVLVLAEGRFGPLSLPWRLALVAGSLVVAAASLRLVEDPVRHAASLAGRPRRGLALGGALCAAALTTGAVARASMPDVDDLDGGTSAAAPVLTVAAVPRNAPRAPTASAAEAGESVAPAVTVSPAALLAATDGGNLEQLVTANQAVLAQGLAVTDVPSNLRPSVGEVGGNRAAVYVDDCVAIGVETDLKPCRYGAVGAAISVVLYGDSHAAQWFPGLVEVAEQRGFELIVLAKGGCPTAAVPIPTATLSRTCPVWRDAAVDFIVAERPDVVIVAAWAGYPNPDDEWEAGLAETLGRIAQATSNLVVIGDNPPAAVEPARCLSGNVHRVDRCAADRSDVDPIDRHAAEQRVASGYGARFVDTSDWLCGPQRCPLIIGDILLYRDTTHLTTAAAEWFTPLLAAALTGIV